MGKISNADTSDVLHVELCSAISDLAKSVDVAVRRFALRSKCSAAIANAAKAEPAAEVLRIAATEETEQAPLVPNVLVSGHSLQQDRRINVVRSCKAMEELYAACSWLATAQGPGAATKGRKPEENAIAMRILELHDRLGGLLKF